MKLRKVYAVKAPPLGGRVLCVVFKRTTNKLAYLCAEDSVCMLENNLLTNSIVPEDLQAALQKHRCGGGGGGAESAGR